MPLKERHDLITATQAAQRLGVARATAVLWAGKGQLRGELVAGVPYLKREDVERLAAERLAAGHAA